jgi:hypothetical protein
MNFSSLKAIARGWNDFWRAANDFALAMDPNPFEDIHSRMHRLEAAVFGEAASQAPPASPLAEAGPAIPQRKDPLT